MTVSREGGFAVTDQEYSRWLLGQHAQQRKSTSGIIESLNKAIADPELPEDIRQQLTRNLRGYREELHKIGGRHAEAGA